MRNLDVLVSHNLNQEPATMLPCVRRLGGVAKLCVALLAVHFVACSGDARPSELMANQGPHWGNLAAAVASVFPRGNVVELTQGWGCGPRCGACLAPPAIAPLSCVAHAALAVRRAVSAPPPRPTLVRGGCGCVCVCDCGCDCVCVRG